MHVGSVVEGRRSPRRGEQVVERGQDCLEEREAVAAGGGAAAATGPGPRPERSDGAVEAHKLRVAWLARITRVCRHGWRHRLPH